MASGTAPGSLLAYFGKQLRRLRMEAGMTQEDLGTLVGYSAALIGMVEKGRRLPSYQLAATADQLLDGRGVLEGLWQPVHEHATAEQQFGEYVELEARATVIDTYEAHLVPELLQTEQYARAVLQNERPPAPGGEVSAKVEARMQRQEAFRRPRPPRLWAVVGEVVLHHLVGSPVVMREQFTRLVERAESHAVTLQVLPFSAPGPARGIGFSVMFFAADPPLVHVDTLTTDLYYRGGSEHLARYQSVFNYLRESALPEAQSVDLIVRRVHEMS